MQVIGDWTIVTGADGNRQAWRTAAGDVRLLLTRAKKSGEVVFLRIRCPDAVFETLRAGELTDAAGLARVEIVETSEPIPAAVFAALVA